MVLFCKGILAPALLTHAAWITACSYGPRSPDAGTDVDLGELGSVQDFSKVAGTDCSEWNMTDEYPTETVDIAVFTPSAASATSLPTGKAGQCAHRTGWEWLVCENMPESHVKKALGIGLLIYYAPTLIRHWLQCVGRFVYGSNYVW
ncbi:hypothetical protein CH63R_03771 [Colletotrichum higginsianum IMI 349063]|uniref:Uncharacterized protein n=1 Tax=Colletotrichum higginsianum (strain IMI 349063) TaxID=759273 RepID=A0A1B7YHK4_COLHI|nr:hypothetical protein CH63R_03771 [Colletotrichum higginsianum IMI 349063]OBR11475.1 hypothetical protein CH63R_03771 [Colletotrichum higginsianum IMI 349063]